MSLATKYSLLLLLLASSSSFLVSAAPRPSSYRISSATSHYLHFPHNQTRVGHAFLPLDDSVSITFDNLDLLPEDLRTNPAPAWAMSRHPLPFQHQPWTLEHSLLVQHKPEKRDVIYVSPATFPPGAYLDINNLTTIAIIAQAAIARMQTWYEDGLYEWTAWWQIPVLGMAYANLDLALGNRGNELLIKDLLSKNADQGYMIDRYVDDQSWWAMFALRSYQTYGNTTWLAAAEAISANSTLYWDDTCGGGVLWLTYEPMIKNTITNGLYFGILARLYRLTGNQMYFQYSMNTLNWWLTWGFETTTGRVHDTITGPSCTITGLQTWTYNSGAFLFGLADLYYATGNTTLLDLGRSMAYAAIRDFSNLDTGVLSESCEYDGQPSADLPPGCQQDEIVFKGVLMMGMAELYLARPDPNIYNYINTQLLAATFNDVDDTFLYGEWWGGPWNETTAGPKTQVNALCLLAAAATVNADFLARSGHASPLVGAALDQIAVPNNATATGEAGSTQRGTTGTSPAERNKSQIGGVAVTILALGAGLLL